MFTAVPSCVQNASPGGFVAVKMTALGKPDLLEHMSSILMETRQTFHSIADNIEDGGSLSDTESSRRTHQMGFRLEHFKAAIVGYSRFRLVFY